MSYIITGKPLALRWLPFAVFLVNNFLGQKEAAERGEVVESHEDLIESAKLLASFGEFLKVLDTLDRLKKTSSHMAFRELVSLAFPPQGLSLSISTALGPCLAPIFLHQGALLAKSEYQLFLMKYESSFLYLKSLVLFF